MRITNYFSLFIITAMLFTVQSCRKDDHNDNNHEFNNSKTVTASLYGIVTDEAGDAVIGASVKLNSNATFTDANGLFFFNSVTTPERATTVVVSKAGYFNGSRTLFVQANGKHTVKIKLMAKGTPQTFEAASGGTVNFDGLSVSFPSNSIVIKGSNTAYNGTVYVYAHKIDPTTELGQETMPGNLRGIGTDGDEKILISYGMFVAELYDTGGNALQIASSSEATVSVTVPVSLQGSAPTTIPLWWYDEAKGIWIEEGSATLQGNKYVGTVKHFSFWNCDTPDSTIDLQMTLVDRSGNPLQGYVVTLINTANNDQRRGLTDNNGWVGGLVYPNATLILNVSPPYNSGSCTGMTIHTQTFTTGNSNQNLGIIMVTLPPANSATIHATVQDCNGSAVSNPFILVQPLGITIIPDASGNVTYTLPCVPTEPVILTAWDVENLTYSDNSSHTLNSGINDIGVISIVNGCNAPLNTSFIILTTTNTVTSQSLTRTLDSIAIIGNMHSIVDSNILTGSFIGARSGYSNCDASGIQFQTTGFTTGTFNISSSEIGVDCSTLPDQFLSMGGNGSVTFTSYPPIGGYVEGNFSMTKTGGTTGNPYNITGTFHILRQ